MATKKATRKTATRRKEQPAAADPSATTPESAPTDGAARRKTARRASSEARPRRKKSAPEAAPPVANIIASESAASGPPPAHSAAARETKAPQIEKGDDTIVIRFPSVGAPKRFAPRPPEVKSARTDAPPRAAAPAVLAEPARTAEPPRPPRATDLPPPPAPPRAAPAPSRRPPRESARDAEVGERAQQSDADLPSVDDAPTLPEGRLSDEAPPEERRRRRRRRGRGRRRREEGGERPAAGGETDPMADAIVDRDAAEVPDVSDEPSVLSWDDDEGERVELIGDDAEDADEAPIAAEAEESDVEPEARPADRRRRRRRGRGRQSDSEVAEFASTRGPELLMDATGEAEEEAPTPAGRVRREMVINVVPREECRIAILEDGRLQEIYLERASAENHVGNIYKGIITNVEPSIQAAFVDFGLGKNGFLHISDLHPQYFPNGEKQTEDVGRKMPRRHRPPIQRCVRRGQELLVQITKEGIGTKGPTLTTYLSVPGRFLVMMPGMRQLGVSRKIEDEDVRRRLRSVLNELELPDDIGFIARTAAEGRPARELQSDLNYLTRLWRAVQQRIRTQRAPAELYRDSDLVIRTIRDVYTPDVVRIVVDSEEVAARAAEFLAIFSQTGSESVEVYAEPQPIFHRFGIEQELERLHSRHVPLKSGGSLVIDQTEALVAIDVNSGRFRTEDDAETTAYKINIEAADEIPRQLRLRDLGGVVVCDFIDMRFEKHRREIERRLVHNLKQHKERAKVLRMSAFGIIEMTRQRQRASLTRSVYQDCRHCRGTGLVKTVESMALDAMRLLQLAGTRENIRVIELSLSAEVANLLLNRKRAALHDVETRNGRTIVVKPESQFSLDQLEIRCFDHRGRLTPHM